MREYASQLYALVASAETSKRQMTVIRELTKNLDTQVSPYPGTPSDLYFWTSHSAVHTPQECYTVYAVIFY